MSFFYSKSQIITSQGDHIDAYLGQIYKFLINLQIKCHARLNFLYEYPRSAQKGDSRCMSPAAVRSSQRGFCVLGNEWPIKSSFQALFVRFDARARREGISRGT